MALDEALLCCAPEGSLLLRFYDWAGPALTFGYSQAWQLALAAAQARDIAASQVVRRSTGGGIVFHDGDLTFSLAFPWPRISPPAAIYEKIHRGVLSGLLESGTGARLWTPSAGEKTPRRPQCFTGPEPFDLVDDSGRKVLGGALRRRLGRGLYQGSLRSPADREAILRGLRSQFGTQLTLELPGGLDIEPFVEKYKSEAWNQRR
jgi:lipoate-protein ligase A